jgi:hypothetical protein
MTEGYKLVEPAKLRALLNSIRTNSKARNKDAATALIHRLAGEGLDLLTAEPIPARGGVRDEIERRIHAIRVFYFEALEEANWSLSPASIAEIKAHTDAILALAAAPEPLRLSEEVVARIEHEISRTAWANSNPYCMIRRNDLLAVLALIDMLPPEVANG